MATHCRTCGAQIPFQFGGSKEQCERCRQLEAAAASPSISNLPATAAQNVPSPAHQTAPAPARVVRPVWQSATFFLIAINVAVFVLMVYQNPAAFMQPGNQVLIKWGADFGPLTLDKEPWRLITSAFLHIGILHIAVNMWSLWILGKMAERFVGPTSLVAIYLLTGVGASLASLAWDPVRVSAGASGAIFGFVGALIGIIYLAKDRLEPAARKSLLSWVLRIAVINLLIGLKAGIDNMAHAGGLVTGAAIGSALFLGARNRAPQDRGATRRNIFLGTAVVLILLFIAIRAEKHHIVYAYRGEVALQKKDYANALANIKQYVAERPDDADGHATLGYIYQQSKQYPEALEEYKKSLSIKPDQPDVQVNIAIIDQAQGKTQEAIDLFSANLGKMKFDAETYKSFGEALVQNGDGERAENMLRNALKLDDKDPETHSDLAKALRLEGRTLEARVEDSAAAELRKDASQK